MLLPSMSPYLLLVKIGSSPRLRLTLNSFTSKLRDALVVISTSVVSTTEKRISPISSESNGFSSFEQAANDNNPIRERVYRICLCIVIILILFIDIVRRNGRKQHPCHYLILLTNLILLLVYKYTLYLLYWLT